MIYTINGKEVEFVQIDKTENKIDIKYYDKLDIVTAHISRIERKLKEAHLNVTICKDLYHGYIGIFLENLEDYVAIIHILEIPMIAFTIDRENKVMIIRINELPKYEHKSYQEILKEMEDYV